MIITSSGGTIWFFTDNNVSVTTFSTLKTGITIVIVGFFILNIDYNSMNTILSFII